jgi:hypothetical protein
LDAFFADAAAELEFLVKGESVWVYVWVGGWGVGWVGGRERRER